MLVLESPICLFARLPLYSRLRSKGCAGLSRRKPHLWRFAPLSSVSDLPSPHSALTPGYPSFCE